MWRQLPDPLGRVLDERVRPTGSGFGSASSLNRCRGHHLRVASERDGPTRRSPFLAEARQFGEAVCEAVYLEPIIGEHLVDCGAALCLDFRGTHQIVPNFTDREAIRKRHPIHRSVHAPGGEGD